MQAAQMKHVFLKKLIPVNTPSSINLNQNYGTENNKFSRETINDTIDPSLDGKNKRVFGRGIELLDPIHLNMLLECQQL